MSPLLIPLAILLFCSVFHCIFESIPLEQRAVLERVCGTAYSVIVHMACRERHSALAVCCRYACTNCGSREYLQYTIKSLFRYSSSNAYRVLDLSDLSELLCEPVFRAFTSAHIAQLHRSLTRTTFAGSEQSHFPFLRNHRLVMD